MAGQLPTGTISFADLNTALGRSATASISLNDPQVRFIPAAYSGAVNMNSFRGRYNWNGTADMGYFSLKSGDYYGYDLSYGSGPSTGTLLGVPIGTWLGSAINQSEVTTAFGYTASVPPTGNFRARTGASGGVITSPFYTYASGRYALITGFPEPDLVTYADTLLPQPLTWQVSTA